MDLVLVDRARALLGRHGEVRPQPASDWTGDVELHSDLAVYYQEVGPSDVEIRGYGNSFFLPRLAKLWEFQAGYRWNSCTGATIADWSDDWLVVADQGGDPFMFSRRAQTVLFAVHGTGAWKPRSVFPNVITMASCLAAMGSIVFDAGGRFTNDDGYICPDFRNAIDTALAGNLVPGLDVAEFLNLLGWA